MHLKHLHGYFTYTLFTSELYALIERRLTLVMLPSQQNAGGSWIEAEGLKPQLRGKDLHISFIYTYTKYSSLSYKPLHIRRFKRNIPTHTCIR